MTTNKRAEWELLTAEVNLSNTLRYLEELRWDAVHGGRYDPEQFERAVVAYRAAEAKVLDARIAFAEAQLVALDEADVQGWAEPEPITEPSSRQLFAKWLVETGRISDGVAA